MISTRAHSGFAIALLLWMIAGMSLMVTAVIHFAQSDTGMAEQRIREAKARAIARGAALLALRDNLMNGYVGVSHQADEVAENGQDGLDQAGQLFVRGYDFGDDWIAHVTIRPSSGFIALNSASFEDLAMLFSDLGGIDKGRAEEMADGVLTYRVERGPFMFVEELLAIEGFSRVVYDRIKEFVHPSRVGVFEPEFAPTPLREIFATISSAGGSREVADSDEKRPRTRKRQLTFESLEQEQREQMGVGDSSVIAVEVAIELDDGKLEQTLWASGEVADQIRRAGVIRMVKSLGSQ